MKSKVYFLILMIFSQKHTKNTEDENEVEEKGTEVS